MTKREKVLKQIEILSRAKNETEWDYYWSKGRISILRLQLAAIDRESCDMRNFQIDCIEFMKKNTVQEIKTTLPELAKAFTKWERAYRRNPKKFWTSSYQSKLSAKTYGDKTAPYFLKILTTGKT